MNFSAMLLNIRDKFNCSKRRVHIDTSAQTDWHQIAYPIAVNYSVPEQIMRRMLATLPIQY